VLGAYEISGDEGRLPWPSGKDIVDSEDDDTVGDGGVGRGLEGTPAIVIRMKLIPEKDSGGVWPAGMRQVGAVRAGQNRVGELKKARRHTENGVGSKE
jgi:hypothetical protein